MGFVVCPTINRHAPRCDVGYRNTMPVPVPKVQRCAQFNAGIEGHDVAGCKVVSITAGIAELSEVKSCRSRDDPVISIQK